MKNFIDENKKPYPFCPGCTHGLVIDAIGRALDKINADPKRTVLVSDIGCVGIADKYFLSHTFHGLHGRSFTYACGIKMANPSLNVFVMVGDGGCGIGGHHLINAARRNVGIKVICFNNFNFGMTGGQASVTTPTGGKTNTTVGGSIETPFDLCSLVKSSGGSFVARKTAFDKDLDEVIAEAMRHNGFSFMDVWELCTAYYSAMNQFKKSDMEDYMAKRGFKPGVLVKEERGEFSQLLRGIKGKNESAKGIGEKFKANFSGDTYDILIAGSAGMKIISAAGLLADAGLLSGLWASEKDDYPVTVQTGHSLSVVKLSKKRINYLGTTRPNAVIIMSEDGLKKVRGVLSNLKRDDLVIAAKGLSLPEPLNTSEVCVIDLDKGGFKRTNKAVAAIAVFVKKSGIIPMEALKAAVEMIPNEKIRGENLAALEHCSSLVTRD